MRTRKTQRTRGDVLNGLILHQMTGEASRLQEMLCLLLNHLHTLYHLTSTEGCFSVTY